MSDIRSIMKQKRICVVVPSYHNEGTIADIVRRISEYTDQIVVVLDGDPEKSEEALRSVDQHFELVSCLRNRGKGAALKEGFKRAILKGYEYAITIDSDNQHYPEDIPLFVEALYSHPRSFVIGARDLEQEGIPYGSRFAANLSNFWFHFQTGLRLPDTQCGYRLYPLSMLNSGWSIHSRYEAELEFLLYAAWTGVNLTSVPVRIYYPKGNERISSFRPVRDFLRMSLLNVMLSLGALLYYLPARAIRRWRHRN